MEMVAKSLDNIVIRLWTGSHTEEVEFDSFRIRIFQWKITKKSIFPVIITIKIMLTLVKIQRKSKYLIDFYLLN